MHFASHEDEACEAEAETDEGNIGDGLLEDDVDVTVEGGSVGVGCVPEVDPVVVELGTRRSDLRLWNQKKESMTRMEKRRQGESEGDST